MAANFRQWILILLSLLERFPHPKKIVKTHMLATPGPKVWDEYDECLPLKHHNNRWIQRMDPSFEKIPFWGWCWTKPSQKGHEIHEPSKPWSHKFQWNMGFQWTFMKTYEWASFPSLGLPLPVVEVPASGYLCYWIFSSHENRVSPWASVNITNKKVEHTHANHYLEFQEGWCLAFITKLVEQTQPKSMKSVQFHPSPPTWKQTPKNTKNNHPKHYKKKQLLPHTKPKFPLSSPNWIFFWGGYKKQTSLRCVQIYCGIRDTFSPRLRLNAKLLYATW